MENAIEACFGSDHENENLCPLFDELIFEILEWLPIKSVLRFRLVSKNWCHIFRTNNFINNHSKKHGSNTNTMLLLRRCLPPSQFNRHQDDLLTFHDLGSLVTEVRPSLLISSFKELIGRDSIPGQFSFIGSCDGIVCMEYGSRYILFNPTMREFKLLPPCSLRLQRGFGKKLVGRGFGVTSRTNDVKVILMHGIISSKKRQRPLRPSSVMVHLYNLSTNSWRRIDDAPGYPCTQSKSHVVFLNGACHWVGRTFANNRKTILSFDINSEVFRQQLELPDCLCRSDIAYPTPVVLNGCIGVVQFQKWCGSTDPIDVWVMKEYGVKKSWIKEFVMSPQPMAMALLPWKNDMLMVHEPRFVLTPEQKNIDGPSYCDLSSLDLHTNVTKEFQVQAVQGTMRAVIYKESLICLLK